MKSCKHNTAFSIYDTINTFIEKLKTQETILMDFDEVLWISTIEKVVIENDITFHFKDRTKIKQELSKYLEPAGLEIIKP